VGEGSPPALTGGGFNEDDPAPTRPVIQKGRKKADGAAGGFSIRRRGREGSRIIGEGRPAEKAISCDPYINLLPRASGGAFGNKCPEEILGSLKRDSACIRGWCWPEIGKATQGGAFAVRGVQGGTPKEVL